MSRNSCRLGRAHLAALLLATLGLFLPAGARAQPPADRMVPASDLDFVGKPAGEISLPGLDGGTVRLSDHKGKVVLLNFWASWCGPCQREMPALDTFYQQHKGKGFVVLSINVDRDAASARAFLKKLGKPMTFPIGVDDKSAVLGRFAVDRMPTSFLVDPKGVIRRQIVGFRDEDLGLLPQWIAEARK